MPAGRVDRRLDVLGGAVEAAVEVDSTWMEVCPSELAELIEVTPEISDNCRSSGAATDVAIVSAFAPGNWADIWTVGISTCGTPAIGSRK